MQVNKKHHTGNITIFFPSCTFWNEEFVHNKKISIWYSSEPIDDHWDKYLVSIPLGEFQQTGCWAKVKKTSGWNNFRVLLLHHNKIIAGFQLLWRKVYNFRIGYISKGPVLKKETDDL